MTPVEIVILVGIGLCAGAAGGLLGIGGSIVMIPALTVILGPAQHLYQAAAMIVNFFVVVPAVYQHRRARAIDYATVGRIAPLAIGGVIAGVLLSELPIFTGANEAYLRGLFGVFLFFVAATDLYRLARPPVNPVAGAERPRIGWGMALLIALPTGLVGGLLGVGGGIVAVPLQQRLLKIPTRIAIANSAATIIAVSTVGATLKNYRLVSDHGYTTQSFVLAAILIPTAIVGSLIGARLTHRVPVKLLKGAFAVVLILASIRLSQGAWQTLQEREAPAPASVSAIIHGFRSPTANSTRGYTPLPLRGSPHGMPSQLYEAQSPIPARRLQTAAAPGSSQLSEGQSPIPAFGPENRGVLLPGRRPPRRMQGL